MRQDRLNHLMILHAHKERTDALDLKEVVNEYISGCEHRIRMFDFWLHFCTVICNQCFEPGQLILASSGPVPCIYSRVYNNSSI